MVSNFTLSGLHVLVVENSYFIVSAMVEDLERAGAIPLGPSPSVSDALKRIAEAQRIDAALLDFRLRAETSTPVAEELRKRGIPFVFVTGSGEVVRTLFPDAPIYQKPTDMAVIVPTLIAMVAEHALLE